MFRSINLLIILSIFCLALPALTYAGTIELNGYLKNESALQADKTHNYTKLQNLLQLELKYSPFNMLELVAIGHAFYDAAYNSQEWDEDVVEAYRTKLALRELYVDIFLDNADIRLGKQQVVWGEAFGLRITDVINPSDFREFILDDFIDSRIPLWLVKVNYYLGDLTFEGLWIPDFEPHKLAEEDSEWEFTIEDEDPSPGIKVEEKELKAPEDGIEDAEWGLKIAGMLLGADCTLSYFSTWDDFPTYHVEFDPFPPPPTLTLTPEHHRLQIWGVNATRPFGPVVFSSETAYYLNKFFKTEDSDDKDGVVKKNYIHYMVSAEYDLLANLTVNAQLISRVITNYDYELEDDKVENSYSLYLRSDFIHETLKPEILAIYSCEGNGSLINPQIKYDLTDRINLILGADILGGDEDSFFGQFDENDRLYSEIKYSF